LVLKRKLFIKVSKIFWRVLSINTDSESTFDNVFYNIKIMDIAVVPDRVLVLFDFGLFGLEESGVFVNPLILRKDHR
jgi:hypothetical protein